MSETDAILQRIFDAADEHAADTGEFDHSVGDLQDALREAFKFLTPEQQEHVAKETIFDIHDDEEFSDEEE